MRQTLTGRIAFIFPGQGSQHPAMARDVAHTPIGETVFADADRIAGFPLSRLCLTGDEATLARTEYSQPAILTVSYIAWRLLEARGVRPAAVAGHSVGEYCALVAAGAITFEDALRLVLRRGAMMAAVSEYVPGGMAAIVGLDVAKVAEICQRCAHLGVLEVANHNSPDQIVISGQRRALETALDLADEEGARAVLPLSVSAPFHCSLMAELERPFAATLADVAIAAPAVPIVANVTADYLTTAGEIRSELVAQLSTGVRWADSVARLAADGIDTFIEVGAGHTLSRLVRQITPTASVSTTADVLGRAAAIQ